MLLEIRNRETKQVSFTTVDLERGALLLNDHRFEERWWVTAQGLRNNIALFTLYNDKNNPDRKSLLALDQTTGQLAWWKQDFSFSVLTKDVLIGVDTKFGAKEVALNLSDGTPVQKDFAESYTEQNFSVVKPFQYHEGSSNYETVRAFLNSKTAITPVAPIEYLEFEEIIAVSAFVRSNDLANYLFVFNSDGEMLLHEMLGEHLSGIALDTFFIFGRFLIFVKNKCELVCYKML